MFLNLLAGGTTLAAQVAAILRKYGTDAHVYLPGIGVINGLTAGNYLDSAGATPATVDNPVGLVVDSGGINAIQATTANKPILRRGAVNLLTYSEQFDNVVWTKNNGGVGSIPIVTANAGVAPDGVSSADRVQFTLNGGTAVGDVSDIRQQTTPLGGNNTYSIYVKSFDGISSYNMLVRDVNGFINKITVTGVWARYSVKATYSAGTTTIGIGIRGGQTPANPNIADILLYGAQLNAGDLADYVPTTTAPASSASGNYHWQFDSTDVLTATFPAGYESATTIDAHNTGHVTLTAQNIVGTYNIGPSIDTYGRFIFRTGLTATELATMQQFANRLAGV